MEVVGEVVLSVSLELLFSKLASSDLWKYARTEQVHTELKKWEKNLKEIREVLDDAENKQISDESVRRWLADLGNLAYDVEDVLDEFNYEVMRRKLVADADSTSKVRRFIPTCCSNFSPIQAKSNVKMGQKINEITRRLQEISGQQADLGLEKLKARIEAARAASQSPIPPPLALESAVCGRDEDKKKIIAMLTDEQGLNLSVVSIVAMGGMGKTTLASLVYDDETCKLFALKVWVCVSDQFDVETITRALLLKIAPDQNNLQGFHEIQLELRKQLKGKRFLIVMDDMWNEEYDLWDSLRSPLLEGASGSKILVTTRNTKVAVMMGGDKSFYELNRLSEEDCWSVFQKHAFENMDVNKHPNLASIGRKIINKCGGLPLAAKALGGLLRHEKREREWEKVLDSKIWGLPTDKCKILPALRLSYSHLPSHLKRCFTYCAIFPCDYEFNRDELIRLWMAEGLIQPASNDDEKIEDVGDGYFCELLSRSFFQSSSSNRSRFVMHDLISDLANSIARDTCLHLDDKLENDLQCPISKNTRHASITRHEYNTFNKFERFGDKEHLRTFIVLPIDERKIYPSAISHKVVLELIPRLRHLRVLSLSDYRISEIPDSFGELKFLRYLNLSNTGIKCLPNSIGNLYNLQTLKLAHCQCLTELPISIGTLVNLRYLDVRGENQLEEMPIEISTLKNLQVLSNLIVGGSNNNLSIKELRDMPHLRGQLCISGLENVATIQDAMEGNLKSKSNLESLVMRWGSKSDDLADSKSHDSENERNQGNVLGFLQPNSNLKKLSIQSYDGPLFPRWVNDPKFSKMVKLSLVNCRKCTSLPCLGMLPSLKHLGIEGMNGVKAVGAEFYGMTCPSASSICFQSLESLSFASMPNWEDWSSSSSSSTESSSFPRLRQLTIKHCPKLIKELPAYLPSLMKLTISYSPRFKSPLLRGPSLNELELNGCNEAVLGSGTDLTSLARLTIFKISGLIKLEEGFMWFLGELQDLVISFCGELINLWEDGLGSKSLHCPRIADGHHQQRSSFWLGRNLKRLQLNRCDKLERLPNGWQTLTSLEELHIELCPELVSFPDVGFPPMLRHLTVQGCRGLKCLPNEMMMIERNNNNNNVSLECLEIYDCSSLSCFPKGRLPTTLKKLRIRSCKMLESLPDGLMMCSSDSMNATMCSLEHLSIRKCSSLTSFPNGRLPTTLKELHIFDCENLESLPQGIMSMHHHSISIIFSPPALQILELGECSSLTSFPQGKFPSTLKKLTVFGYPQLESISCKMFDSTDNSLEFLTIRDYPILKTLPDCLYNLTELCIIKCKNLELLPHQFQSLTRLTYLKICDCENVKIPLYQWGLTKLPSLKSLSIGRIGICPNADSFSDDHHSCPLPTTLTFLEISRFQNLESLTSLSLQTLTSLIHLNILDCPKLQSILPRNGVLSATLSLLVIQGCPLLKARYSTDEGEDWPKIAHIPSVQIN